MSGLSREEKEKALAELRAMNLGFDDSHIRNALEKTNYNLEEAVQILVPESPQDVSQLGYHMVSTQTSTSSSQDRDVLMRETEHGGSGADSDRDSTTVSYSLEEERNLEEEEEEGEEEDTHSLQFQVSREEGEDSSPPRSHGLPPRYEDVVADNQEVEDPQQEMVPRPGEGDSESSIEFPLTHFYALESRVHTDQWSIPYKRGESLAICIIATTNMIREGE